MPLATAKIKVQVLIDRGGEAELPGGSGWVGGVWAALYFVERR